MFSWTQFLADFLGISSIFVSVFIWVGKKYIDTKIDKENAILNKEFQKEIDKHKTEIENKYRVELQTIQNEFEVYKIRFSDLHLKRTNKIEELYNGLLDVVALMQTIMFPFREVEGSEKRLKEQMVELQKKVREIVTLFQKSKIYYSAQLNASIDKTLNVIGEKVGKTRQFVDRYQVQNQLGNKGLDKFWEIEDDITLFITEKIEPTLEELRIELRPILGVES